VRIAIAGGRIGGMALALALHEAGFRDVDVYESAPRVAVSLDRTSTPQSLIVPEYDADGTGTRVVCYPLDASTLLLRPSADGYVHGSEAYRVDLPSMQGATAVAGKFSVSSSRGASTPGSIYTFTKTRGPTEPPAPCLQGLRTSLTGSPETSCGRSPSTRASCSVLAIKASAF
jgi:hypothetical protein